MKISENGDKYRDKMELKYDMKKKHVQANTLSAMSRYLELPNRYQNASDVKRLTLVVIGKGSGKQPVYKLVTGYYILTVSPCAFQKVV